MTEEVKQLQDELETTRAELEKRDARIAELESGKDNELRLANTRINELTQAISEKDGKIITLNDSLVRAVKSYKALVVKSTPGVLEELITGDTVEAIDQSLGNTLTIVSKVKQRLEDESARTKIPAGAPQRTPLDLSALSAREKIQYAITKGGK